MPESPSPHTEFSTSKEQYGPVYKTPLERLRLHPVDHRLEERVSLTEAERREVDARVDERITKRIDRVVTKWIEQQQLADNEELINHLVEQGYGQPSADETGSFHAIRETSDPDVANSRVAREAIKRALKAQAFGGPDTSALAGKERDEVLSLILDFLVERGGSDAFTQLQNETRQNLDEVIESEADILRHKWRDEKTGALNANGFENTALELLQRLKREKQPGRAVAIVYMDMNNFKNLNEEFGHDAADRVLQEVVQVLKRELRDKDAVARTGGDEFALAIEAPEDKINDILQRVSDALSTIDVDGVPPAQIALSGGAVVLDEKTSITEESLPSSKAKAELMASIQKLEGHGIQRFSPDALQSIRERLDDETEQEEILTSLAERALQRDVSPVHGLPEGQEYDNVHQAFMERYTQKVELLLQDYRDWLSIAKKNPLLAPEPFRSIYSE